MSRGSFKTLKLQRVALLACPAVGSVCEDSTAGQASSATPSGFETDSSLPVPQIVQGNALLEGGKRRFDVVLGNPPYLEQREVDYQPLGFRTQSTGAIHAMFVERATQLLKPSGSLCLIVPMAVVCTKRMKVVQDVLEQPGRSVWYAHFSWRPGRLFPDVNRALTIITSHASSASQTYTTGYQQWKSYSRRYLFDLIHYVPAPRERKRYWVPKFSTEIEHEILDKFLACSTTVGDFLGPSKHRIYYRTTGGLYWKVFTDFPPSFRRNGKATASSRETFLSVGHRHWVPALIATLSSDFFWWWYTLTGNLRDLNPVDIAQFPLPAAMMDDKELARLGMEYGKDLQKNSRLAKRKQVQTGLAESQTFEVYKSRRWLEAMGKQMAGHYGLNEEEVDYLQHYDLRHRLGGRPVRLEPC